MSHKKEAILKAFVQLLDEKPTKRITVNDIAERCGIGRNTFYYYFPNIPALFEALEKEWVDEVMDCAEPCSIIACVEPLVERVSEHKSGFLYVYRSVDRESFLGDLDRMWTDIVRRYITRVLGESMKEQDRELLTRSLKSFFVGATLDWMDAEMEYDLVALVRRSCRLLAEELNGNLSECLKNL